MGLNSEHDEQVSILIQALTVVVKDEKFSLAVRCAAHTLKEELVKDQAGRVHGRIVS